MTGVQALPRFHLPGKCLEYPPPCCPLCGVQFPCIKVPSKQWLSWVFSLKPSPWPLGLESHSVADKMLITISSPVVPSLLPHEGDLCSVSWKVHLQPSFSLEILFKKKEWWLKCKHSNVGYVEITYPWKGFKTKQGTIVNRGEESEKGSPTVPTSCSWQVRLLLPFLRFSQCEDHSGTLVHSVIFLSMSVASEWAIRQ